MSPVSRYAAVATFVMLDEAEGGCSGYAMPSTGRQPCLIELYADQQRLFATTTTRFSPEGLALGYRLGWCGFEVQGLRDAAAFGDRVTLNCGVSGRVLHTFDPMLLLGWAPPARTPVSVMTLIEAVRALDSCSGIEAILPFAEAHLEKFGIESFVHASFRTLMGRSPEPDLVAQIRAGQYVIETPEDYLGEMMLSDEYVANRFAFVPGPYHPQFAFDRSLIG